MNALDNANIEKPRSGLASFAFPEAKSSKTGVSVVVEQGTYVYLAMVWRDVRNKVTGKKHRKLFPFMNILFAYVTPSEAEKYVKDSRESRYTTYYYNHFDQRPDGLNPPLTVSTADMEPFVRLTMLRDEHVMEVDLNSCNFVSDVATSSPTTSSGSPLDLSRV